MKRKPTLDDIAALAGVSKTAVSMILNEKQGVTFLEETIEKVHEAAKELGYAKKTPKLQKVSIFNKNTILVLAPTIASPFFTTLVQSIEQEADKHDIHVIIQNTFRDKEKELKYLQQIRDSNLYGLVLTMLPHHPKLLEEINESIPVVIINERSFHADLDTVEVDNYSAGVLIAEHMISFGHKHIAYLTTALSTLNLARLRRLEGINDTYRKLCPEGTVTVKSKRVRPVDEIRNIDLEHDTGFELAHEILPYKEITGIVASTDMIAYGVMDALKENGFSIPEDYSVCGFDNLFPSKLKGISLTTVEHYILNKGQDAVEIIRSRQQKNREKLSSTSVLYRHKLIIRNSTGPARKKEREE
ncbi:LacI family DNA-binding transcriptional regulator [Proteiniclasticum sp. SCR006]|uniref:LacI family DNA-binding transcriptional regulator n=1 Tax=Proteiniclasticum aestuarii TaxID=2817862 RepID=A0A939HC59_9CLOT|nr:LacI family DNA-binding transcriptional regulator [Proteiniclasticum aestuarii]MBO1265252.1 LacI family DNA-binding transcriptional regulator [Proteiniclasticum aestuarii]